MNLWAFKKNKHKLPPLKFWQKFLLIGFSFLIILGGEGILRWRGYGGHPPLFIPLYKFSDGRQILGTNPKAQILFFLSRTESGNRVMGYMNREILKHPKPKNGLRILFVGESTVQGYPHPRTLCTPAFLLMMLHQALPDKDIEIINLGITAVASYPVWKITRQALDYDPDLVVVYAGHNEYFGAFGVASLQSVGSSTFKMNLIYWLRGLAIYQYLAKWMELIYKNHATKSDIQSNLLEVMAGKNNIPIHSKLRQQALNNLENHLRLIIRACKGKKTPVVMCTLVSNERDMAPLQSPDPHILNTSVMNEWQSNYNQGLNKLTANSPESVDFLKQAAKVFPTHALTRYHYAQALEQSGDTIHAADEYKTARDLDEMPWRAAETTNHIIRSLVESEDIWLADIEEKFRNEEPLGNGWKLMADHLHPSLEGQILAAKAVFDTLYNHNWASLNKTTAYTELDWKITAQKHGNNPMEEYKIAALMASLWNNPPFSSNNQNVAGRFFKLMDEIESRSSLPEKKAFTKGKMIWMKEGKPPDYSYLAAEAYLDSGNPQKALDYFKSSWLQSDDLSLKKLGLSVNLLTCIKAIKDDLDQGEKFFAQKSLQDADILGKTGLSSREQGEYYKYCGLLHQMLNEHSEAAAFFQKSLPYHEGIQKEKIIIDWVKSLIALHKINEATNLLQEIKNIENRDELQHMLNEIQTIKSKKETKG